MPGVWCGTPVGRSVCLSVCPADRRFTDHHHHRPLLHQSLEQEVKEARQKIIVVEGELAAEREAGQAVRARLASGAFWFDVC